LIVEDGWFVHSAIAARASEYPPPMIALGVEERIQDAVAPFDQR
jgi:hypothetical protein